MKSDVKDSGSSFQGNAQFGVQLTGEAKGSQPVLLVFAILSFFLLVGGIASILISSVLGWAAVVAGGVSLSLGIWLVRMVCRMWNTAQPTVDSAKEQPIQGTISISETQLAISGTDATVFAVDNRNLVLTLVERLFMQKQLPPPSGEVIGSPADAASIRQYSPAEAEVVNLKQCEDLQASKEELSKQLSRLKALPTSLPPVEYQFDELPVPAVAVHVVPPRNDIHKVAAK